MIRFINFYESLTLKGCLCVAFFCEREGEKHGVHSQIKEPQAHPY
jgi:hypothetical protein